jgi:hypothetical protein
VKTIKAFEKVQKLQKSNDLVPYHVWTSFEGEYLQNNGIQIMGDQVCLGGDYKSVEEIQESLKWLVEQFGGKVDWK